MTQREIFVVGTARTAIGTYGGSLKDIPLSQLATTAVSAALFQSLPFDTLKDFAPVSMLATFDLALAVSEGGRFKSLADLLAFRFRSTWAGALTTIIMLIGVLPLLALQIQALAVAGSMGVDKDVVVADATAGTFIVTLPPADVARIPLATRIHALHVAFMSLANVQETLHLKRLLWHFAHEKIISMAMKQTLTSKKFIQPVNWSLLLRVLNHNQIKLL